MPDRWRFDELPNWGRIQHRCIEEGCGFPAEDRFVPEAERKRHFEKHVRERERDRVRRQRDNAARARKAKRQQAREKAIIDEKYGEEKEE